MNRVTGWIRRIDESLPVFHKVVIANTALIAGTAVASAWAVIYGPTPGGGAYGRPTAVLAAAIGISLFMNYLLMRLAFHPLFLLRQVMDEVRRGAFARRARHIAGDPDVAQLVDMFNLMLDELADYRHQVSSQILRAMEDERKRFARELHDETSQALTNLVIRLDLLDKGLESAQVPALREELDRIRAMAAQTLAETRRLTFDLRPTILDDLGLVPALRWYVKNKMEPLGLDVKFTVHGFQDRLPDDVETALFRIIQEAFVNVIKHAQADRVDLTMVQAPGALEAVVEDDGQGFDKAAIDARDPKGRGLGLFGMRERAELVGGHLEIESTPGQGTRVKVNIPYPPMTEVGT